VARVRIETNGNGVVMEIADDGCGFEPDASRAGHFGLDSMRSRAAEIGAKLTIASEPELGTVVRVDVPASVDGV
jgi:signal transduction histidine kinase